MIIDNTWVINYIKRYGNIIVIPREATIIKKQAFDYQKIEQECGEGNIKLKIEFEEESQLETIESMAFFAEIVNTIVLPKNIKKIEEFAFYGFPISVQLDEDSSIEVCDNDFVFLGQKEVKVPTNLRKLEFSGIIEKLEKITIPTNSKLEDMIITNGVDKIILPNGQELLSTDEKSIRVLRLRENKVMVLYLKGEELYYEICNIDEQTILQSRKYVCITK